MTGDHGRRALVMRGGWEGHAPVAATDLFLFVPYTITMLPEASTHPITAGIADFDLVTEQYWVLTDDYVDVLATTTQKVRPWDPWHREVTSPVIWTRRWGSGKIFVTTPGHSLDVLRNDSVRTIIERGMLWASR
ncbi:ThuA domain-containing protein [Sphaerisporangium perillae]|uniref:ThuA domain-containing protein n=1 Tax=Sphaerisporangium perillae TaxID=2935860 RepID=UPI00201079A6|nr:ThuA domain-containing protein [Sphaerisporangium perillae]